MRFSIRFLIKNKALRYPAFRKYLLQRFCLILALNMQTTIVAYWVYSLTSDVLSLGKLGLFEAIPAIGCSLFSGHFVDHREKRSMLLGCLIAYFLLGLLFCSLAFSEGHLSLSLLMPLIYTGVFFSGAIRAFTSPASFTLFGLLLPRKLYANGATWSSTSWQSGAILGPLLGGLIIAVTTIPVGLSLILPFELTAIITVLTIARQVLIKKEIKEPVLFSIREGMRFIVKTPIILTALMLDMFAVLFGGATALLPAYAKDILKVGEASYGWLRAAPGIGAVIMFMILSVSPLKKDPGLKLALAVAGFGGCMIIFGVSTIFWLSLFVLFLSGGLDAVSVVVRSTILQLYTPDEMRGRVSAVNTMFISSSNEIGELESGTTAKWFGTKQAVVIGGCATLMVVAVAWVKSKALRELDLSAEAKNPSKK